MKLLQRYLYCFLALFIFSATINAAVASPLDMLNKAANNMISALSKNKARLNSQALIFSIVKQNLIPHIDLDRMAGAVVGRDNWTKASASQRQTFIQEFMKLVTSTYAAALASYDDDRVQFYPLRGGYENAQTMVVNSIIIRKTGQRIPISYNVSRVGSGWKVYDFNIENISMVQSYRSQFSDVLARSGLAGLNQQLIQHNRAQR